MSEGNPNASPKKRLDLSKLGVISLTDGGVVVQRPGELPSRPAPNYFARPLPKGAIPPDELPPTLDQTGPF